MAVNFTTELGRQKLFRHMSSSDRCLKEFRSVRERLIAAYEGDQYGGSNSSKETYKVISNSLLQLSDVYMHLLASTRPRANVTTKIPELKPFAYKFTQSVNLLLEEIHIEDTFRRIVQDAFFGLGVAKICMGDSGSGFMQDNVWYDPGRPYVDAVDLDDFIYDTKSPRWNKILFASDRYRTCREYLETDDRVNQKALKNVPRGSGWRDSDDTHDEYVANHTDDEDEEEAAEMIELVDVWLPTEQKIVTWPYHNAGFSRMNSNEPLMVVDWEGPEEGPYEILQFSPVPNNIFPVPPAWAIEHLNRTCNLLLSKLVNQAEREKKLGIYNPQAEGLAKAAQNAQDGDLLKGSGNDPRLDVGEITVGGASQIGQAFLINLKAELSSAAGNLNAMAGLGPQADTATQDSLIHASVSKREANLQKTTTRFVERVVKRVASLMWGDNVNTYPAFDTYPDLEMPDGSAFQIDNSLYPGQRDGDFFQYNFDIEPYSMVYESPQQRANKTLQLVTQIFLPMQPIIQQQGGQLDLQKLVDLIARDLNQEELRDIVIFDDNPQTTESVINASDKKAGAKVPGNKTYEHVNRSLGPSQESKDQQMIQSLMRGAETQNA